MRSLPAQRKGSENTTMNGKRPNIVFIIADQHNARMLGAAGDDTALTPNLDALASRGVLFSRAYATSPICSPSRISIMTGKEPSNTGYYGNVNWTVSEPRPDFLPTLLRNSGYETALVGRSHMVRKWDKEGFDHLAYMNLVDCDRYDVNDCPWMAELIRCGVADNYDIGMRCSVPPEGGFVSSMPLEHCEEMWVARECVAWMRRRDADKPFFLHVGYDHPHDPIAPPAEFDRLVTPEMVKLPLNHLDDFSGKPERLRVLRHTLGGYPYTPRDVDHLRWLVAKQYALIALIDHSVGLIVDEVRQQGELENTIFVYTSDHGDLSGEHGMVLKNIGITEAVHRSPLIISGPSDHFKQGHRTDALVQLNDIYGTLLGAAGIPVPPGDSLDLSDLLNGRGCGRRNAICDWENIRAIRTCRYRLVEYVGCDEGELYDHDTDPGELNNLWSDPTQIDTRIDLLATLGERIPPGRPIHTSYIGEMQSDRAKEWICEDSPFVAMWLYGLRWSELQPYLEERLGGGQQLKVPAKELAKLHEFKLPSL